MHRDSDLCTESPMKYNDYGLSQTYSVSPDHYSAKGWMKMKVLITL